MGRHPGDGRCFRNAARRDVPGIGRRGCGGSAQHYSHATARRRSNSPGARRGTAIRPHGSRRLRSCPKPALGHHIQPRRFLQNKANLGEACDCPRRGTAIRPYGSGRLRPCLKPALGHHIQRQSLFAKQSQSRREACDRSRRGTAIRPYGSGRLRRCVKTALDHHIQRRRFLQNKANPGKKPVTARRRSNSPGSRRGTAIRPRGSRRLRRCLKTALQSLRSTASLFAKQSQSRREAISARRLVGAALLICGYSAALEQFPLHAQTKPSFLQNKAIRLLRIDNCAGPPSELARFSDVSATDIR